MTCAALILVPATVFTGLGPVVDAGKTHSWMLARQNLETLWGREGCGLADDASITLPDATADVSLARLLDRPASRTLALPPVLTYFPCARQPTLTSGVAEPPTLVMTPTSSAIPVRYHSSPFLGA